MDALQPHATPHVKRTNATAQPPNDRPRSGIFLHADTTRRVGRADAVEPVLRKSADFVTMTAWLADGTRQVNGRRRIPNA